MTPDIRLEFRLTVKAGPQTIGVAFLQKSCAANEDLVRRPVSSTYDVFIGMQYGYTTRAAPRRASTSPVRTTRPASGDTPSRRRDLRVPPERRRPNETPCARQICLDASRAARSAARRATPTSSRCSRFYQEERSNTGSFEAGIEMALRRILADPEFIFRFEPPPAGVPAERAVSHHRHRAGLAPVVLPLVQRSPTMSC